MFRGSTSLLSPWRQMYIICGLKISVFWQLQTFSEFNRLRNRLLLKTFLKKKERCLENSQIVEPKVVVVWSLSISSVRKETVRNVYLFSCVLFWFRINYCCLGVLCHPISRFEGHRSWQFGALHTPEEWWLLPLQTWRHNPWAILVKTLQGLFFREARRLYPKQRMCQLVVKQLLNRLPWARYAARLFVVWSIWILPHQ